MNDDLWECPYCGAENDRAEGCCYSCEADRQPGKDEIAADVLRLMLTTSLGRRVKKASPVIAVMNDG